MNFNIVLLHLLLVFTDALRARVSVDMDVASAVNASVGQHSAGQLLRDRYRLQEYMVSRGTPGRSFPRINRRTFRNVGHLGKGSFGDVWSAYDTKLGRTVAVKIFYQKNRYMTWANADRRGRAELEESKQECNMVQQILGHRKAYPVGAARICECFDEHISDAKGTNNEVFLVQEMCGDDLEDGYIGKRKRSGQLDWEKARMITKQMIQGIAFLQMFNPPLIHHDLKPANVCMNAKGEVKIIDWGGTVFGTKSNMFQPAVATPLYTPPEASKGRQSFAQPYWSYDMYAIGLMHMQLVCPMVDARDWFYELPLQTRTVKRVINHRCPKLRYARSSLTEDLTLIRELTHERPDRRAEPIALLHQPTLEKVPVPKPKESDVHNPQMIFRVGDDVEYWSETHKTWLPAVVGSVDYSNNQYDLHHKDGTVLKQNADAQRVRKPEEVAKATVPREFFRGGRR